MKERFAGSSSSLASGGCSSTDWLCVREVKEGLLATGGGGGRPPPPVSLLMVLLEGES